MVQEGFTEVLPATTPSKYSSSEASDEEDEEEDVRELEGRMFTKKGQEVSRMNTECTVELKETLSWLQDYVTK